MSNIELLEEKAGWEVEDWVAQRINTLRGMNLKTLPGVERTLGAVEVLEELADWLGVDES